MSFVDQQKELYFKAYLRLKLSGKSRRKVLSILEDYDRPVDYDRKERYWLVQSFSDIDKQHRVFYNKGKGTFQCECNNHFFTPYDPEVDYKEMCIHIHLVILFEKCFK